MTRLTDKQRRLVRELDEIASLLRLNYREIRTYEKESWTPRLKRVRDHFIRGEVILEYTLVDEFLNNILCHHFFGRKISFIRLWKTKKFRNFNYYVLEKLYLLEKLAYVKAFVNIPRGIVEDINRLNTLRNAVAHAFFPENLRSSKPTWKGKDIFSIEGLGQFNEDMAAIDDYFICKMTGIKP